MAALSGRPLPGARSRGNLLAERTFIRCQRGQERLAHAPASRVEPTRWHTFACDSLGQQLFPVPNMEQWPATRRSWRDNELCDFPARDIWIFHARTHRTGNDF